jgi:hypothetical protein
MNNNEWLKDWPILDTVDFDTVTVDVTKWDDSTFTIMFNFYEPTETEEPPFTGFSMCTQMGGSSLQELYDKLVVLLGCGFFDNINVSANGIIWSSEGEELGEINWLDFDTDGSLNVELGEDVFKVKGTTTLQ